MRQMKQQKASSSSGTLLGEEEEVSQLFCRMILNPSLSPSLSLFMCLSYVRLITGFVFLGFIQPLCPCGVVIVCKSSSCSLLSFFPSYLSAERVLR